MDDLKRQRQDLKNEKRRRQRAEKAESIREADAKKLIADAEQRAAALLLEAEQESKRKATELVEGAEALFQEARVRATRIEASIQERCQIVTKLDEKVKLLDQMIADRAASIEALDQEMQVQKFAAWSSMSQGHDTQSLDPDITNNELTSQLQKKRLRREKDAERSRRSYWKRKEQQESILNSQNVVQLDKPNRSKRRTSAVSKKLVDGFNNETKTYNNASKRQVLETFWGHPIVRRCKPSSQVSNVEKSVTAAFQEVRKSLRNMGGARRKDELAAHQNLLSCMVGQTVVDQRCQSGLARAFNTKRETISKARKRRERLDADKTTRYSQGERKTRRDKLSPKKAKHVQLFWEINTRVSPNKKDEARRRLARGVYEYHQIHWLEDTEVEFYLRYKAFCAAEKKRLCVGLRSFQKLKPFYIRTMKDRNVCCCKHHVEMDLLKEAVNKFRVHSHPKDCSCTCATCRDPLFGNQDSNQTCMASKATVKSVREWCEQIVCPKQEGHQWHKKDCIMGLCESCGTDKLLTCDTELDPTTNLAIDWHTFQYVTLDKAGPSKAKKARKDAEPAEKESKRLRMVYKTSSMDEFFEKIKATMPAFLIHNFRARWQSEEYKRCLATFPRGTIVSSIDFAENYTFAVQNEVQSMHWDNKQHCLDKHWQWMQQEGIRCDRHVMWSDGCAAQFKSCRPFYFVSRYYATYGAEMTWCFHASGHGKGVNDGLGGTIKTALSKEQRKGTNGHKLQNAHDVVEFCKKRFAVGSEKEYGGIQEARRYFWEIGETEVDRSRRWDCAPVRGTRGFHCFQGSDESNPTLLRVRDLACFCPACFLGDASECQNAAHVGPWEVHNLVPKNTVELRELIKSMGPGQGLEVDEDVGCLGDFVNVGDYFAIEADKPNRWKADFYVLLCTEVQQKVKRGFTDGYGMRFKRGDMVIKGRWYQQYGRQLTCFVLHEDSPDSFVHAESVIHRGFGMLPTGGDEKDKWYTMPVDTLEHIFTSCKRYGAVEDEEDLVDEEDEEDLVDEEDQEDGEDQEEQGDAGSDEFVDGQT